MGQARIKENVFDWKTLSSIQYKYKIYIEAPKHVLCCMQVVWQFIAFIHERTVCCNDWIVVYAVLAVGDNINFSECYYHLQCMVFKCEIITMQ
jgi:hypothetical protein